MSVSSEPHIELLSDEQILLLCAFEMTEADQAALSELLERQREGSLSEAERPALDALMGTYRGGLVRKAQALKVAVERGLWPSLDQAAIAPLALLSDAELWQAGRTRFPAEAAAQLAALNLKRQREELTEVEASTAATLVSQYEQVMLMRAEAAALLKQRGHDVSGLLGAA